MIEIDYIIALYTKKTRAISSQIDETLTALIGSNDSNKSQKIAALKESLSELNSLVDVSIHPEWLTGILRSVNKSESYSPPQRKHIVDALIKHRAEMESHVWTSSAQNAFDDPDKIFMYYKSQSKLNELATTVSSLLSSLLESDELNERASVKLVEQVKLAIEASERMRSGSAGYTNTNFYLQWLKSLTRNVLKKNLESLPVIGPTVAGINEAIDEMSQELTNVVAQSEKDIVDKLPKDLDVPLLGHQSSKEYIDSIETAGNHTNEANV